MNQLAVQEQPQSLSTRIEASAIISMIERVARDPTVDISRLERLLEMQERVVAQRARTAYMEALAAMQPELPVIDQRGKIEVRKKDKDGERTGAVQQSTSYALWADINEAIRPVLGKYCFALSFRTGFAPDGRIIVTGILSHAGGHQEETTMTLPHDSTGSKNAVQAIGSSTSYGKRYTASALLNLTSRAASDADDDGMAAGGDPTISEAQLAELITLADDVGADKIRFCNYMKIDSLASLRVSQFERAKQALEAKRSK